MNYISVKDAAKKWKLSIRRVQFFCASNKIPGVKRVGNQWIIPIDSEYPTDGRAKRINTQTVNEVYHFPLFVHSPYYASQSELSDDELVLFKAQEMLLTGEYVGSIELSRKVLKLDVTTSLKFGAYCTIAYNSIVLGLTEEYHDALDCLFQIYDEEKRHKEDYALLIAAIRYHGEWDDSALDDIDVNKLSLQALIAYQYCLLMNEALCNSNESKRSLMFYSAFCKELEYDGIMPSLVAIHGFLAVLYYRNGNNEARYYHLDAACKIAVENNWITLLAKFSIIDPEGVITCLMKYGGEHLDALRKNKDMISRNRKTVLLSNLDISDSDRFSLTECEYLLHLANGYTDEEIATVKYKTNDEVKAAVDLLCQKSCSKNRNELVFYAKELFEKITG